MLVLQRHIDQCIIIGEGLIKIMVVDVKRGKKGHHKVRIGIEAPPELRVDREEIFEKRQQEKKAS